MPSKLGNALPLFINVRKWIGLLLTSSLLHNFTQVKVKEACLTELLLKRAMSSVHHLKSNPEELFAYIFFFTLNYSKDLSKFNSPSSTSPI